MKLIFLLTGLCLLGGCFGLDPARPVQAQEKAAQPSQAGDEAALKALVAEFTRAFNAGEAKAVAALFTEKARVVTMSGRSVEGREAIEQLFVASFQDSPGQRIEVKTESLRFLDADAAIEEGTATVALPMAAGESRAETETTRYTAVYVKRDGKWLQDSIRDYNFPESAEELTAHDHLKELEWLVGDWIDESDEAEVRTTCRWSEHQAYLIRSFEVKVRGKATVTGSQRIGWDPRQKQIKSWVFDSDGGFSEGFVSRDGERWVMKSTGVLKDGRTASATNVLTRVNRDTMTWGSVDRTLGAEVLPDAEQITLVRTPPQPRSARPRTKTDQPERAPQ